MSSNLDDFVSKYIVFCAQLCKVPDDYTKENVARHNKAMKKLNKLRKNLSIDRKLAENVYGILLNSEDAYIKQSAATDCLLLNIHVVDSVEILKRISLSGNRMAAMTAKRTLLIWEGKISNDDPF